MNNVKEFWKREISGWTESELCWLAFANVSLLIISVILKDTFLGIAASLTGVTCVIFCGKGKISNYIFGTINVLLYSYIAFKAKFYGEVMLNMLYYFPTNILGWFMWKKNMNSDTGEVVKKRMSLTGDIITVLVSAAGIFGYSYVLKLLGGNLPLIDSMSTVLSIVAQILMIKRFTEQWVVWILVDAVSVIMWATAFFKGDGGIAMVLMWSVYLLNAIFMFIKWYKDSAESKAENTAAAVTE
ncbi:MAG: nicotinamide mononucleotide transporter [Oscillospiraceae bacterium]|nr:nicotinamide mononucleotide transporter [Oscillospiraceae bacterium]